MTEHSIPDDSSHYEISLTAGQAFIAFVLLLCSLGAAFAFGVLVGRGQLDERLVVRSEPPVLTEGPAPGDGSRIVEAEPVDAEPKAPPRPIPSAVIDEISPTPPAIPREIESPAGAGPVLAQVLASSEQARAEALAARLIEAGFDGAYVERVQTDRGMIHRVRVRFSTEAAARSAESRLRAISGADEVLITRP
ncbi:MAG TPA: SPOR domain-containing protein [Thermoanaerobaculia bacterium]|nr:SPOR domain-containing protein [Thermoanaerobaculia bacterium]